MLLCFWDIGFRNTKPTPDQEHPDRIQIAFDDHRLVANAGLLLPVTFAQHLGLCELVDNHVDLGDAPGRANPEDKMLTLAASTLARSDCIDDADVLRTGGMSGAISAGKSCAIRPIIARRTGVRKGPIRAPFPALSPAVKPPQASYRPHVRFTGAYVAFRNRISNPGGASGNESSGIQCYGIHTTPLEWKAVVSNGLQSMPFHGMPIDIVLRHGNGGSVKRTNEFGGAFTTIWATP